MALSVVVVASGGLPVTEAVNGVGLPITVATNGYGIPVTVVASGGLAVVGTSTGGSAGPNYRMPALLGSFVFTGESMTPITGYSMTAQFGDFRANGQTARLTPPSVGYQGPGDLTPGAIVWCGLRAYSSAQLTGTTKAIRICDSTFNFQQDIFILPTGLLDYSSLNNWITAHGQACVQVWYDQSGNGNDLIQGAANALPRIDMAAPGRTAGRASLKFDSSIPTQMTGSNAPGAGGAQPVTLSVVCNRTVSTAGLRGGVAVGNGGNTRFGFEDGTNKFFMFATAALVDFTTPVANNNTFYAVQAVYDDAHSNSHVNVTSTALGSADSAPQTIGTQGFDNSLTIGVSGSGDALTGYIIEVGGWHTATVDPGMGANQISSV